MKKFFIFLFLMVSSCSWSNEMSPFRNFILYRIDTVDKDIYSQITHQKNSEKDYWYLVGKLDAYRDVFFNIDIDEKYEINNEFCK